METYKIAVIAGDGVGPEVISEGMKVLNKVAELDGTFRFEFTEFPWGCEYYLKTGKMMDDDGIETLAQFVQTAGGDTQPRGLPVPAKAKQDVGAAREARVEVEFRDGAA